MALDGYRTPPHKLVIDWDNRAVGKIREARLAPRTRGVAAIVVSLSGEAQRSIAPGASELEIPVRLVHSIRSGEVVLECSLESLRDLPLPDPRRER